jgi:hypothetical protein
MHIQLLAAKLSQKQPISAVLRLFETSKKPKPGPELKTEPKTQPPQKGEGV